MQIHKIRLGHATNSSSTHSLIMLDDAEDTGITGEFGWDFFTAASLTARESYFSILLRNALSGYLNYETAGRIVQALTGVDVGTNYYDNYIDHQSVYTLPVSRDGKGIDWGFYEAFKAFILQDGLVILGGNDNDEKCHPLLGQGKSVCLPIPQNTRNQYWARRDSDYWALFNPSTGAKIRFSFDDLDRRIEKASAPELIDLRITNYCTMGCPYCYMDSGLNGKHAENITDIVYPLADLGVFEVAIGGGEPTEHPKFAELVGSLHRHGIVPNFSTRNHNWFHVPANRELLQKVGKVGFSVSNSRETRNFCEDVVDRYDLHHKIAFHVVDETMRRYDLQSLLSLACDRSIDVTILGFKEVGRGKGFAKKSDSWIEAVRAMREAKQPLPRIGIDTAIVQGYGKELKKLHVHSVLLAGGEGKFSMYIDLVDGVVGRSSYERDTFVEVGKLDATSISEAFQEW